MTTATIEFMVFVMFLIFKTRVPVEHKTRFADIVVLYFVFRLILGFAYVMLYYAWRM